jgi:hypothetical protein
MLQEMAEDNKLMEERVDVLIRVRYFSPFSAAV